MIRKFDMLGLFSIIAAQQASLKACSNGPNNVGPTSCNNFQIVFCAASLLQIL